MLNGPEATLEGRSLIPPTPAPPCSSLSPTHNNTLTDHRKPTGSPQPIPLKKNTLYHTKLHTMHLPTLRPSEHTCSHLTCLLGYTHATSTQSPTFRLPVACPLASQYDQGKEARKKELQSLVGLLHDASVIVCPGHTFLRRLINLIDLRPANSFLHLNLAARSDILWWRSFIESWNGLSMMQPSRIQNPDIVLTSDASGSWGCGAYYNSHWLQYQWSHFTVDYDITAKELLPIVFAAAIWGREWENKSILCRCDNEAVVHIINTGTSRDPIAMGMIRCLSFISASSLLPISQALLMVGRCIIQK